MVSICTAPGQSPSGAIRQMCSGASGLLVTVAACRSSSTITAVAPESARIHATWSADEVS